MYHPDKYENHNTALKKFIGAFNKVASQKGGKLEMYYQEVENFRDDGGIIYKPRRSRILYDFEKRFSYYDTCKKFKFASLGQFERKLRKPEIKLSIQVSTDEKCFMIAWHADYKKEERILLGSKTATGRKEYDGKRFTKDFIELSYGQFDKLYDILLYAFEKRAFDKSSFKIAGL